MKLIREINNIVNEAYRSAAHDDEVEDMRREDRYRKQYERKLMAHPDCRDPDHPGCKKCDKDDEE